MSNLSREIISITKLRRDGRKAEEARKTNVRLGAVEGADGSVYFEQGENKILAHISGPKVPSSKGGNRSQKASLTCSYTVAPFARTGYRRTTSYDRRQSSESHTIKEIFQNVIQLNLLPGSEINIFVQVLQADGGELCSALNAVSLALIHAGVPCADFVTATTTGYYEGHFLMDLNHFETSANLPQLELGILPSTGRIVFLRMASRIEMDVFKRMVEIGISGCKDVHKILKENVMARQLDIIASRTLG
jgi:exosome complex component RRP41|eukprot:g5159.t1